MQYGKLCLPQRLFLNFLKEVAKANIVSELSISKMLCQNQRSEVGSQETLMRRRRGAGGARRPGGGVHPPGCHTRQTPRGHSGAAGRGQGEPCWTYEETLGKIGCIQGAVPKRKFLNNAPYMR